MKKKLSCFLFLFLLAAVNLFGQVENKPVQSFDAHYKLILRNAVQDKNFYLLSLFQNQAEIRANLQKNKILRSLTKQNHALKLIKNCGVVSCYDKAVRLSEQEIETVARVFENSATDSKLMNLVENHLRPSGMFIRYSRKSDAEMLALAWRDAAKGLNHILDVYGLGKDAAYKEIDNVSYDVNGAQYAQILKAKTAEIKLPKNPLFFEPALAFALKLLEANRRDEAGRYEPLEEKENKKAFDNLKKMNWNDYPYSVILVLGSGPNTVKGDSPILGKIGIERTDAAVKLFQQRQAPLLIFSGGHVHPSQTPFSEAVEMKKYVMQKYGIAEEAILIDPHARHTTTNIRNAARIMFRDGIPTDKKGLITSSESHIDYVIGETFKKRNMDELGFVPMQLFKRISPVEVEFLPLMDSLFVNSIEPLDP